ADLFRRRSCRPALSGRRRRRRLPPHRLAPCGNAKRGLSAKRSWDPRAEKLMENVLWACAFVLACIAFYRFGLPWLKRFDRESVAGLGGGRRARSEPNPLPRRPWEGAEERVEEHQKIQVGAAPHYFFGAGFSPPRGEGEKGPARRIGTVA